MKTKTDKKGQQIAINLLPLTPMEEAQKAVLTKAYNGSKGNISLTARTVNWSRTKTLKRLQEWKLYDLYKHEPGPFKKDT